MRCSIKTLRRRLVTFPVTLLLFVILVGLLPVWLGLALLVDLVRKLRSGTPFAVSRLILFGAVYLSAEVVGLIALGLVWLFSGFGKDKARLIARTYSVQRVWVITLFGAVRFIYGVKVELEGVSELGDAPGGPVVILMQHTSLVDTLLPTTYLTDRRGLKLRWVLKRELLVDPCLDVAGSRLPNAFVSRDGSDTERALSQVKALATDLPPDEGVLIYPEGTRFTPSKKRRALERLAHDPVLLARAERLQRVLPPRPGGPLALIEAAQNADVVLVAHVGFEGLASLTAVLSGALVGQTIHLRFWRVPRTQIPEDRQARIDWLWQEWEALDRWVDARASADEAARGSKR